MKWKEGATDREFALTQYVTNPSRAGLLASMLDAGAFADGGGGAAPNVGWRRQHPGHRRLAEVSSPRVDIETRSASRGRAA